MADDSCQYYIVRTTGTWVACYGGMPPVASAKLCRWSRARSLDQGWLSPVLALSCNTRPACLWLSRVISVKKGPSKRQRKALPSAAVGGGSPSDRSVAASREVINAHQNCIGSLPVYISALCGRGFCASLTVCILSTQTAQQAVSRRVAQTILRCCGEYSKVFDSTG